MGYVEHPNLSAELKNAKKTKPAKTGPAADLVQIKAKAKQIVADGSIGSRDRMVHLKDAAHDHETEFSNQELNQYIWDARRELAGARIPDVLVQLLV